MEPNFTPEQIEMINRIVFEQIEIMHEKVAEIIADTETVAHQRLKDNGSLRQISILQIKTS